MPVETGKHDIIDRTSDLNLEELVNDLGKVSSHLWSSDYSSVKMSIDSLGPCSKSQLSSVRCLHRSDSQAGLFFALNFPPYGIFWVCSIKESALSKCQPYCQLIPDHQKQTNKQKDDETL